VRIYNGILLPDQRRSKKEKSGSGSRLEVVSKLSIGFEVKEGAEAQPEEYMEIFRGLRFKPDVEIGPETRF
jgi:hypothetical protein